MMIAMKRRKRRPTRETKTKAEAKKKWLHRAVLVLVADLKVEFGVARRAVMMTRRQNSPKQIMAKEKKKEPRKPQTEQDWMRRKGQKQQERK